MPDQPHPGGRPPIEIDLKELKTLCAVQCTLEEIACYFRCSEDTIERRVQEKYGITFREYLAQESVMARFALRSRMWEKAIKEDNTTMQIFLSKQKHLLGYSDNNRIEPGPTGYEVLMGLARSLEERKAKQVADRN